MNGNHVETILIVEDDRSIRKNITLGLEQNGFTVHSAKNGLEGLEKFREIKDDIDMIISDVKMPKMSGPKMVAKIKEDDKSVPVIFISGSRNIAEFRRYAGKYTYKFISKPFSLNILVSAINE